MGRLRLSRNFPTVRLLSAFIPFICSCFSIVDLAVSSKKSSCGVLNRAARSSVVAEAPLSGAC